jgi:alpha-beta hydrolase superfamily lysophospholipase
MPNGLDLAALSRDPAVIAAYQADPLVHDRLSGFPAVS